MSKTHKRNPRDPLPTDMMWEPGDLLDRLSVGNWVPNVDICEAADVIMVRVELPGIEPDDIHLTIRGNVLRIQGLKREPAAVRKRISYYCLERRYGKFDRQISIDWVVDSSHCRASLADGLLTVMIPRIENRRGELFEIPVTR
jgi:HSP20 family protein